MSAGCLGVKFLPTLLLATCQADQALAAQIAVAVSIRPPATTVDVRASQQFTATLANDPSDSRMSWTVTGSGQPRDRVGAAVRASGRALWVREGETAGA